MSRCFPFPPSGYAGKCSSKDALIVSIKLQEEGQNSIPDSVRQKVKLSDKKDKKREKKEKKGGQKDKKRNEKEKFHSAVESEKLKHNDKDECKRKRSFEVLERSNVTEEHGQPVDLRNVSCSSDSTGNSSKRKRHSSPASSIQGNGNIIRIRLSSRRRNDPRTSGSIPCEDHSTSQSKPQLWSRPEPSHKDVMPKAQKPSISQKDVNPKVQEPSMGQKDLIPKVVEPYIGQRDMMPKVQESLHQKDLMPKVPGPYISQNDMMPKVRESLHAFSTSMTPMELVVPGKKIELPTLREVPTSSGRIESRETPAKKLSSREKKMLKRESLHRKLFENLAPPKLENELGVDQENDDDWLFGKKDTARPAKRLRAGNDDVQACMDHLPCSASALLQPCAHFMSDVGVYALPFTVPF